MAAAEPPAEPVAATQAPKTALIVCILAAWVGVAVSLLAAGGALGAFFANRDTPASADAPADVPSAEEVRARRAETNQRIAS